MVFSFKTVKRILLCFARPLDYLSEAVFPSVCLICGRSTQCVTNSWNVYTLPLESLFCSDCRHNLSVSSDFFCRRCGRINANRDVCLVCPHCTTDEFHFESILPLHLYKGTIRSIILHMKRDQSRILAIAMSRIYYLDRKKELLDFKPDCIIAVPMHWRRSFQRGGINAPDIIARSLAKELGIPCYTNYVKRQRSTLKQTIIDYNDRFINVYDAFKITDRNFFIRQALWKFLKRVLRNTWSIFPRLKESYRPLMAPFERFVKMKFDVKPNIFSNKNVIIVDDTFTTGSTVNEIARILKKEGKASCIMVAVIARAGLAKKDKR